MWRENNNGKLNEIFESLQLVFGGKRKMDLKREYDVELQRTGEKIEHDFLSKIFCIM